MMVARTKRPLAALRITFERDGEEPANLVVTDGKKALLRALSMLIAHRELQAGDKLTITAAE